MPNSSPTQSSSQLSQTPHSLPQPSKAHYSTSPITSPSSASQSFTPDDAYVLTSMSVGKKNPDRINIMLNRQFAFSLDLAQVSDFKLKVGQVLTPEDIEFYRKASNLGKLYATTLNWIFLRPRSIAETRDYLKRKQFKKPEYKIEDADISGVLSRLLEKGYLNDVTFTDWYVDARLRKKGISKKKLRLELTSKYHIDQGTIDAALEDASRPDSEEILKVIEKKRRLRTYNLDDATEEEADEKNKKLIRYLVAQGFSYELSKQAVLGTDW